VRPFLFSGMHLDRYPVKHSDDYLNFRFVSEGPKGKIDKAIVYYSSVIPGYYSLGFGDWDFKKQDFDDLKITNNGDCTGSAFAIIMML
jgi:hypothetical protein